MGILFWKKKSDTGMIDLRELHKRGLIRIKPVEKNKEGYVDMSANSIVADTSSSSSSSTTPEAQTQSSGGGGFFSFFSSPNSSPEPASDMLGNMASSATSSIAETTIDSYSKRDIDRRVEELNNIIYKLEQRIELLERKAGVTVGGGW
jgi:hypothetical protein